MLLCFFRIFDVLNELEFDLCEIELDLACFCHTTSSRRNVIHLVSRVIMQVPPPPLSNSILRSGWRIAGIAAARAATSRYVSKSLLSSTSAREFTSPRLLPRVLIRLPVTACLVGFWV
ncbi:hypothetical protein Y032_0012g1806 [Ancylostoma ceylanicum]|uniref:Uncharacterized protein n=1 Tax=Ancylostoma ceylanicum TaxID=53326 RepID=A0A016VDE3_9BILA|nr:hypothetical protein Y032_0012g1806 [Ancylostoma ceylanicum]